MVCRNCKYMYTNETMKGLYICVNGNAENFTEFTGICCEDECEYGESELSESEFTEINEENENESD